MLAADGVLSARRLCGSYFGCVPEGRISEAPATRTAAERAGVSTAPTALVQ